MTKKHFEAIAGIIASERNFWGSFQTAQVRQNTIDQMAGELAGYFATENPRFDRKRFLAACGVDIGTS